MTTIHRKLSFNTLTKIENILICVIIWACILSIHFAYRMSGANVLDKISQSIKHAPRALDSPISKPEEEKNLLQNDQDFFQPDLEVKVLKELEESKKEQEQEMYKEAQRRKDGEFYSVINVEDVYKWFDEKPNRTKESFDQSKKNPELPKYLINGKSICASGKVDILLYVHSKVNNAVNRNSIRETFGNTQNFQRLAYKVVFILGKGSTDEEKKKIKEESEKHHDIVQADFDDVHRNLSLKVLTFLQWIIDYCSDPTPRFIVKVDDDFFLNPFLMIEEILPELLNKENFVACHSKENSPVVRSENSKWYVSEKAYPKKDPDVFKKTCSGYTAIFPGHMVPLLRSLSVDSPILPVDDAYLFSVLFGKIKNAEYIQILDNMTLNKETGIEDYKGNKRLKYLSVTSWGEPETMNILWKGTLKKLTRLGKQLINSKRLET